MKLVRADNAPGFARDLETGAIININKSELHQAREAKQRKREKELEFERMKSDIDDIKRMLTQIVEKL